MDSFTLLVLELIVPQIKEASRKPRDASSYCYRDSLQQSFTNLELRFNICVIRNIAHYCAGVGDEGGV